jgi:hypothetical protein
MNEVTDRFSSSTRECLRALRACQDQCLMAASTHLLEQAHASYRPQHLRLMMDCAAACAFAADLITHKSQFHTRACALAADICTTCAKDCEPYSDLAQCCALCREASASAMALSRPEHSEVLEMASMLPPGPTTETDTEG